MNQQRTHENNYKVGDIVLYQNSQMHGYVIKSEHDMVQVVNENCN